MGGDLATENDFPSPLARTFVALRSLLCAALHEKDLTGAYRNFEKAKVGGLDLRQDYVSRVPIPWE